VTRLGQDCEVYFAASNSPHFASSARGDGRPHTVVISLQLDDEARDLITHPVDVRLSALLPPDEERRAGQRPGSDCRDDYRRFLSGYGQSIVRAVAHRRRWRVRSPVTAPVAAD
jgi:CO/xanthine dehydrogenase Mo-binding subunit